MVNATIFFSRGYNHVVEVVHQSAMRERISMVVSLKYCSYEHTCISAQAFEEGLREWGRGIWRSLRGLDFDEVLECMSDGCKNFYFTCPPTLLEVMTDDEHHF